MKKLIYLLLLLTVACAPAKKTTKTDTKSDVKTNTEVSKKNESSLSGQLTDKTTKTEMGTLNKNTTATETANTETETVKKIFDTSKPVDPATGTPPLASEERTTNKQKNNKQTAETIEQVYSQAEVTALFSTYFNTYNNKMDSVEKVNASLKSEISEKVTAKSYWYWWLLAGIFLSSGIWCVVHFKLWRKLSFMGWI